MGEKQVLGVPAGVVCAGGAADRDLRTNRILGLRSSRTVCPCPKRIDGSRGASRHGLSPSAVPPHRVRDRPNAGQRAVCDESGLGNRTSKASVGAARVAPPVGTPSEDVKRIRCAVSNRSLSSRATWLEPGGGRGAPHWSRRVDSAGSLSKLCRGVELAAPGSVVRALQTAPTRRFGGFPRSAGWRVEAAVAALLAGSAALANVTECTRRPRRARDRIATSGANSTGGVRLHLLSHRIAT
jgi:hypothetical protein